ncbi:glycosyltransferase [Rivularia sp. UHCC 0363]|uniref:glycosyltransferase n=1 Tax=Rivularia sp. UHCC 0363 TaxID=3110244 RepID=UPI002B21B0BB|nr:glycosyltransferase [Rivularia sp. UHCC 0363]MEA5598486.1 glycosyltransferase [Rivularia sp. UHCC 0363]
MTITPSEIKYQRNLRKRIFKVRTATLFLFSIVILSAVIVAGWFAGEGQINAIFAQINVLQKNPPMWLEAPMVTGKYLLVPTVSLLLTVLIIMKVSPQPRVWSRRLVVGILLILTGRYVLWRSLSTLNLDTPLNGVFSLALFGLEMMVLFSATIQLFLMLNVKEHRHDADRNSIAVIEGNFNPSVDVLIPTYNEPAFILRRTIIGCQALEYDNKVIYLLDDTRRPEMKALAEELGCKYITRMQNNHAKAGNLNHALTKINGEFIVVFDADFIPTKNFLTRTVGFFQDEQVALVQTPQSFYNADPIAHNLGLENVVTPEEEVFYRQIQPIKDSAGSVVCAGTSFVIRRSSLEKTGGFVTESLSEDYFTGINLSAKGYKLIYLDEKLSAGLAAENISAHATQRIRWAQGTLQAFFIKSNPLTIKGLKPLQRLAHLEGLLNWFASISRVGFLLMPLAYSFLGIIPIQATLQEALYFLLPFYLTQLTVFSWLNSRSRSAILSEIYSIALAFPLALTVIKVMLNPFSKGFNVTPKGNASNKFYFNWNLALPLIILFIANAVSLWRNLGMCLALLWQQKTTPEIVQHFQGLDLGWIWSIYNLMLIGIALLILLDAPKADVYEWFDLRRVVRLDIGEKTVWGITTMISEIGAEIALTQQIPMELIPGQSLELEISEEKLQLNTEIIRTGIKDEFPTIRVRFPLLSLSQHRSLVEMLFCRPGQWKHKCTPGEWQSFILLFKILLKPRILFDRKVDISAIALSKV